MVNKKDGVNTQNGERNSIINNQDIIDTNTSLVNSKVNLILSDEQYKNIIGKLLENWTESNDNSTTLSTIINRYGKKGIDIIFELEGIEYFYTLSYHYDITSNMYYNMLLENAESEEERNAINEEIDNIVEIPEANDLSESEMIKNIEKYIPSLELRQYICENILIEALKINDPRVIEGYLVCCENSELYTGHEKLLVKFCLEIETSFSIQLECMGQVIQNSDLNIIIQEIYKAYQDGNIDLDVGLDIIFDDYDIDQQKLTSESLRILKENGIL